MEILSGALEISGGAPSPRLWFMIFIYPCTVRGDPAEEASVSLHRGPAAVDPYHVAVVWPDLDHLACLGPLPGFGGLGLVLDHDYVPGLERRKVLCPDREPLLDLGVPLCVGLLSEVGLQPPLLAWLVIGHFGQQKALYFPPEYDHCGAELRDRVNHVLVFQ
jgi:hypothetical protein